MDGYLPKPDGPDFAAASSAAVATAVGDADDATQDVINVDAVLERVEGNTELVRQLANIFLNRTPALAALA